MPNTFTMAVNAVSDTLFLTPHALKNHPCCPNHRKAVLSASHLLRKSGTKFADLALNRLPS